MRLVTDIGKVPKPLLDSATRHAAECVAGWTRNAVRSLYISSRQSLCGNDGAATERLEKL